MSRKHLGKVTTKAREPRGAKPGQTRHEAVEAAVTGPKGDSGLLWTVSEEQAHVAARCSTGTAVVCSRVRIHAHANMPGVGRTVLQDHDQGLQWLLSMWWFVGLGP